MKTLYWNRLIVLCCSSMLFLAFIDCNKNNSPSNGGGTNPVIPPSTKSDVDFYLTTGSQTSLLQKQNTVLAFTTATNGYQDITVDTTQTYQTIDGFGFTL